MKLQSLQSFQSDFYFALRHPDVARSWNPLQSSVLMASRSQPRLLSTAIFHRFVFLSRSFSSISDLRSCSIRQPDLSFLTIRPASELLNLKPPPVHGDVSHLLAKLPHTSGHSRGNSGSQGGHLDGGKHGHLGKHLFWSVSLKRSSKYWKTTVSIKKFNFNMVLPC